MSLLAIRLPVWILSLLLIGTPIHGADDGQLTGSISDPASAPLAGVSVLLSSLDRVFQTRSNTNGRFLFGSVPRGLYELEVSAPGFVKQRLPIDISNTARQSIAIVLKLGSMPDMDYCGPHPSITYGSAGEKGPRLAGVIAGYWDKKPVAKAEVTVVNAGKPRLSFMCSSDATGKFEVGDIPAGYYDLRISRRGYQAERIKPVLLPRENTVRINMTVLKRGQIVACQ